MTELKRIRTPDAQLEDDGQVPFPSSRVAKAIADGEDVGDYPQEEVLDTVRVLIEQSKKAMIWVKGNLVKIGDDNKEADL